ncbi:UbiA family prenyltransferase [Halobacterium jilantaiense]|uniref:4-hydroxybenzoate polyprenyltransferase n=1 Tax=Halobacterium jilantaiense TaxID=355548 RepID=A0A1I0P204_9EURY|nr:UbiA family prenyltransferase [Halobacterium jilantaiense]SEW08186.1 4-hydroxybenzoate polyprenyltransferase [Halobacterium jilantaiense]
MGSDDHPAGVSGSALAGLARRAVHGNLVVSLAATSVAATTAALVRVPVDPLALFVVFAATLFVYSADRVADADVDAANLPRRAAFARRHGRTVVAASTLLYVAAVALAAARGVRYVEFLALPVVAVGVYSGLRAKRVFLAKNLLVGGAWAAVPLGVGAHAARLGDPRVWLLAAWTGSVITVAAVVFDVKDVHGDRAAGIDTIPVRYGPAAARRVATLANAALALAVVALVATRVLPGRFLVLLVLHAYVAAYVPFATPDRSALFYGLVVDGEHVVLALIVLVLHGAGML